MEVNTVAVFFVLHVGPHVGMEDNATPQYVSLAKFENATLVLV